MNMTAVNSDFDHAITRDRDEFLAIGEAFRDRPIAYTNAHGGFWVASRYEDIQSIMLNSEAFICSKGITIPSFSPPVPVIPLESDAPLHVHYRSALLPFLTPKALRAYEDKIRSLVRDALQSIAKNGGGDAVADFAAKIPTRAMAAVFGFSDEDGYRFDHDFTDVVNAASSGDPEFQARAVQTFADFLRSKLNEKRADPSGDDVVSAILRYDAGGRPFTEEECLGLLWSTAGGAVDTTKHAIGHAIYDLGVNKDVRQRLIDDSSLIPTAVEEVLRLDAPAYMTGRHIAKEVAVGGVTMQPGDRVLMVFGWANRDARAFENPGKMDITRKSIKHLSFGHGMHQCAGMHLGRLEIKIAIEELLRAIPDYELVDAGLQPKVHGGMMWYFETLPIRAPVRS